jgi:virginiamycin B lyase
VARVRNLAAASLIAVLLLPGSASAAITEFPIPTANSAPNAITRGPDGALWFTESSTSSSASRIARITTAGTIEEFPPLPPVPPPCASMCGAGPQSIATGSDGALWFTKRGGNGPIGRLTSAGGLSEFALPPQTIPGAITAGPDGALWFTEGENRVTAHPPSIGRITIAGSFSDFQIPANPFSITAGPDGALWFTEVSAAAPSLSGKIGHITTAGGVSEFPLPAAGTAPDAIARGPDGALWFIESGNGKIGRITTTGRVREFALPSPSPCSSEDRRIGRCGRILHELAAGPDRALWFTEDVLNSTRSGHTGEIGRITTAGSVSEFPTPTAYSLPEGITAGPDRALWFTEKAASKIGRITTTGNDISCSGLKGLGLSRCRATARYKRARANCQRIGNKKRRAACVKRAKRAYHRALAKVRCQPIKSKQKRAACLKRAREASAPGRAR